MNPSEILKLSLTVNNQPLNTFIILDIIHFILTIQAQCSCLSSCLQFVFSFIDFTDVLLTYLIT